MEDHRVLACKVLLTLSVLALLAILLAVTDAFGISRWLGLGTLPWLSGAGLLTAASATGYGKHHQITDLVRTVCWIVLRCICCSSLPRCGCWRVPARSTEGC